MIKVKEDVTNKYYDMINSFRADNTIKISEIQDNKIAFDKSYFEVEKELIKNKNQRLMNDIELLEELEFGLRHEYLKIVEIDRDSLYNEGINHIIGSYKDD